MNIVSTEFDEVLKVFIDELDPEMKKDDKNAVARAFLCGMQAGTAVLTNRLAVTTAEVSKLDAVRRANLIHYLGDVCVQAQISLDMLDMDMRGAAYGTA